MVKILLPTCFTLKLVMQTTDIPLFNKIITIIKNFEFENLWLFWPKLVMVKNGKGAAKFLWKETREHRRNRDTWDLSSWWIMGSGAVRDVEGSGLELLTCLIICDWELFLICVHLAFTPVAFVWWNCIQAVLLCDVPGDYSVDNVIGGHLHWGKLRSTFPTDLWNS